MIALTSLLYIAEKVAEVIFVKNLTGVPKPSNLQVLIESQALSKVSSVN
ncbi:hypothetical protein [Floridanema flaviceps]